ncbi:hypothetical protein BJ165DRAFT_1533622 [Panaeolus papilionaceus]|nr:hypothetical protein BJ165DRAFT_1533622 [Panaeolus papilionaceus]
MNIDQFMHLQNSSPAALDMLRDCISSSASPPYFLAANGFDDGDVNGQDSTDEDGDAIYHFGLGFHCGQVLNFRLTDLSNSSAEFEVTLFGAISSRVLHASVLCCPGERSITAIKSTLDHNSYIHDIFDVYLPQNASDTMAVAFRYQFDQIEQIAAAVARFSQPPVFGPVSVHEPAFQIVGPPMWKIGSGSASCPISLPDREPISNDNDPSYPPDAFYDINQKLQPTFQAFETLLMNKTLAIFQDVHPLEVLTAKRISNVFLSFLDLRTLFAWEQVCRRTHHAVNDYISFAYSIGPYLSPFFPDEDSWHAFRQLQLETDFLVCGLPVLYYFDCLQLPRRCDLDVFVNKEFSTLVCDRLRAIGFLADPNSLLSYLHGSMRANATNDNGCSTVIFADVFIWPGLHCKTICVFTCSDGPLQSILDFTSTIYMNFFSYHAAYSLFARATLVEHHGIVTSPTASEQTFIYRFNHTQWSMAYHLPPSEMESICTSAFRSGGRFVGDNKCWTICFDNKQSLVEGNLWTVNYREMDFMVMDLTYGRLVCPAFTHTYTTCDSRLADILFDLFVPGHFSSPEGIAGTQDSRLRDVIRNLFSNVQ